MEGVLKDSVSVDCSLISPNGTYPESKVQNKTATIREVMVTKQPDEAGIHQGKLVVSRGIQQSGRESIKCNVNPGLSQKCAREALDIDQMLASYIMEKNINPVYLETLKHIIASENTEITDIPLDDLKNMLRSLAFAEVSKHDHCFKDYNIKLIKTGGIFHTWMALHGTSIFNEDNHYTRLNYVQDIIDEAKCLAKYNKPLLVVYSSVEMTEQCIKEMETCFSGQDNIIVLCIETELNDIIEYKFKKNIFESDHIRLEVLNYQESIMAKAKSKAERYHKSAALKNIEICSGSKLVYSDMDNDFEKLPRYLIAFGGVINAEKINNEIVKNTCIYNAVDKFRSFANVDIRVIEELIANSTADSNFIVETVRELVKITECAIEDKSVNPNIDLVLLVDSSSKKTLRITGGLHRDFQRLYDNISDKSYKSRNLVRKQRLEELKTLSLQDDFDRLKKNRKAGDRSFFRGDNGFLLTSTPDNSLFKNIYHMSKENEVFKIDFHYFTVKSNFYGFLYNEHHKKANDVAGYQLSDSVIIGNDSSWYPGHYSIHIPLEFEGDFVRITTRTKSFLITKRTSSIEVEIGENETAIIQKRKEHPQIYS